MGFQRTEPLDRRNRIKLAAGVFDYQAAVRRIGGDELLKAHAWEFLQLHDAHVEQLRGALRARDAVGLASAARTLHLALRGLSGARCRAQALAIERLARAGAFDSAESACSRMQQLLGDLVFALDFVVTPKPLN
jgi:HPt (histidine-containing phosphotransfer) domain-containing protein